MANFLQQINLLARKNLKVRFSRKSSSCFELVIPLLIFAFIGFTISRVTDMIRSSFRHGGSPNSALQTTHSEKILKTPDEYFACRFPDWRSPYQCEHSYDFINSREDMLGVSKLSIQYVFGNNVIRKGQYRLARAVMNSVVNFDESNQDFLYPRRFNNFSTKWIPSQKSEKELEICVIQNHKECQDMYAAVVITNIEDAVGFENKFTMEYKIRLTVQNFIIKEFHSYTDRLFVDFHPFRFDVIKDEIDYMYINMNDPNSDMDSQQRNGFIFIQTFLDRGITNYIKKKYRKQNFNVGAETEVKLSLVRMPYIRPPGDSFADIYIYISVLFSVLNCLTIFSLMGVNSEKCSGFKELLRIHGVTNQAQWMGWLLSTFAVNLIWTFLLTLFSYIQFMGGPNMLTIFGTNFLLFWLLLLLFMMSLTTLSFLISVFFERVWTAASVGLLVWIMLTVIMVIASAGLSEMKKWTLICFMVMPTVAFNCCLRFFIHGGGTFTTMGVFVIDNVQLTTLHCLFMLLLDSIIFMTLTIYMDNVLPSKYGVRKSPFYFLPDFRKFFKSNAAHDADYRANDGDRIDPERLEMTELIPSQQPFQPDPENVKAAVVIRNLKKRFHKAGKWVVDGLSAKMLTGENYALLGVNGAGKTTTMGILTGLTSPNDGMAQIFNLDIRKDMDKICKQIGWCPQDNILIEEMTVLEQITLFGKLKGVDDPAYKAEELLKLLGMSEKLHNKPEELSGGHKRLVHLAIAVIGDPKLAFLDQPTSGLDPKSRRDVWDFLVKLRGKMTVVLITHDMEEADMVGDRIGIMSEGKIVCSGTPSFLKKYYGVGYNLEMSQLSPECDREKVYNICREYVPNAKERVDSAESHSSLFVLLPSAELDLSKVADLMEALENQKAELGIESIKLSLSTMDDVFLKVEEALHEVNKTIPVSFGYTKINNVGNSRRYVGAKLYCHRFTSLVFKRIMYFCETPLTLLSMVIFFSAILCASLLLESYEVKSHFPDKSPSRMVSSSSLSLYPNSVVHLFDNEEVTSNINLRQPAFNITYLTHAFKNIVVKRFSRHMTFQNIMTYLKKASLEDLHQYRESFIGGVSFNISENVRNVTGFYSVYALHSAPLFLNMISQEMIKKMYGIDAHIGVINHPFKRPQNFENFNNDFIKYNRPQIDALNYVNLGGVTLLVVIISLLTATAVLLPTEERLNKSKQLQLMTGTSPFLYWTSMFTCDFLFFSLVNGVITLVYILADYVSGNWMFTNNGAGTIIFLILECYTFSSLWFCYLISLGSWIKTPSDSFILIIELAVMSGVIWSVIQLVLFRLPDHMLTLAGIIPTNIAYPIFFASLAVSFVACLFVPMSTLFLSMLQLGMLSIPNSACNWFPEEVFRLACNESSEKKNRNDNLIMQCCSNCREDCFIPEPYFNFSSFIPPDLITLVDSMHIKILVMILSGVLNAGMLFALEYVLPKIKLRMAKCSHSFEARHSTSGSSNNDQDENVVNEAARVDEILKDNATETANHALLVQNLHLKFGKLKAVSGLSFEVHRGDCFGLLGVNGAGKTSTFRMLTGDIFPSCGNIHSGGLNIYKHRNAYLSSLGYCPQFDGIIDSLTGLQMVKLYGALRGIPPDRLKEDAAVWLDKFGILGSANKKCGQYSGGMKRRLSAAIAVIGNPNLLLLDELTSGIDPAFRPHIWNVIRETMERGQSVLLASHMINECDALCSRVGIMVEGQFKCLGNPHHLKNKFGNGYTLVIKFRRGGSEEEEETREGKVKLLMNAVDEKFDKSYLHTKQKTLIQYQILNESLWYSDIFRLMEQVRKLVELEQIIEEYSVTQTNLEDGFLSFLNKMRKDDDFRQ